MILSFLLLIIGLLLLVKGADWLVDGASVLAKKYNVSDLAIGLTIVAFGTSAPELVVNSVAASGGYPDIVFGNVIGSNNFNLFIILGIAGLITPLSVQSSTVWKEIPFSLLAAIVLLVFANDYFSNPTPILSSLDGFILLGFFAGFLFYVFTQLKSEDSIESIAQKDYSNLKIWGLIFIGLGGLVIGGKLVVDNAVSMAQSLGVSEKIIGLTIVAAGTSLPELATSVVASMKKNNDIAIGNIIGSNIFNLFLILGVSSIISPLEFKQSFNLDIYILLGGTIFLFLAMFTGKRKNLDRWEAAILLLVYLGYTTFLVLKEISGSNDPLF
ncbi:calcium/sodium antiporter [Algoriphagus lutimaris]|uniref:calcium/sodium antiporter n=1 Tax=Algoriphagus lutimaris TaxID=613197 RepID=UPI00196A5517|nr:calcium/sodium antiporter [Algoriphagus lutimaris]MBN3520597.1 calcium/sodium antiporter [Algoriphagus lutimaris]